MRDLGLTCTSCAMPCVCRTMICHRFARTGGKPRYAWVSGKTPSCPPSGGINIALRALSLRLRVPTVSAAEETLLLAISSEVP